MDTRYLERLTYLLTNEQIERLQKATVLVCGCGGVGSFCAEALARTGIGHIILVDHDVVNPSNLNRQLMTTKADIGRSKVEVLKKRLEAISDCKVEIIDTFIDDDFTLPKVDYVADCIDTLIAKFALVKKAKESGIPSLSALGSAKRLSPKGITHTKLSKTRNDPLAKAFRSLTKKEGYYHDIPVVFIDAPTKQVEVNLPGTTSKERHPLGSTIFAVGSVGLYMAYVICSEIWSSQ